MALLIETQSPDKERKTTTGAKENARNSQQNRRKFQRKQLDSFAVLLSSVMISRFLCYISSQFLCSFARFPRYGTRFQFFFARVCWSSNGPGVSSWGSGTRFPGFAQPIAHTKFFFLALTLTHHPRVLTTATPRCRCPPPKQAARMRWFAGLRRMASVLCLEVAPVQRRGHRGRLYVWRTCWLPAATHECAIADANGKSGSRRRGRGRRHRIRRASIGRRASGSGAASSRRCRLLVALPPALVALPSTGSPALWRRSLALPRSPCVTTTPRKKSQKSENGSWSAPVQKMGRGSSQVAWRRRHAAVAADGAMG